MSLLVGLGCRETQPGGTAGRSSSGKTVSPQPCSYIPRLPQERPRPTAAARASRTDGAGVRALLSPHRRGPGPEGSQGPRQLGKREGLPGGPHASSRCRMRAGESACPGSAPSPAAS